MLHMATNSWPPPLIVVCLGIVVFLYALINPAGAKRMSETKYYKRLQIPPKPIWFYRMIGVLGVSTGLYFLSLILWKSY
jgi:hypothetical protein